MPQPLDSKAESLRQQGVLNPHPEKVADPLFHDSEFFDPRDLVQVKYEMLRRVRVEAHPSPRLLRRSGSPVPSSIKPRRFYHRAGLPGLIPQRPGPRQAPQALRPHGRFPAPTSTSRPVAPSPPRSRSWFESTSASWSIPAASNVPWSADEKKSQ